MLQPDGNFVVYETHHIDSKSDYWNSGTRDNRKAGSQSSRYGRFVIYKKNGIKKEPMASLMAIYRGLFSFQLYYLCYRIIIWLLRTMVIWSFIVVLPLG